MATRYSVTAGAWTLTSTWSATDGGAPGASAPVTGDKAIVKHMVTVNQPIGSRAIELQTNGDLVLNGNVSLDDAPDAYLYVHDDSSRLWSSPSGYYIKSASANPTHRWRFIVEPFVYTNLALSTISLRGCAPTIAYPGGTNYAFNVDSSAPGYIGASITHISPKSKTPVLDYHRVAGRSAGGRTYPRGCDSPRFAASGFFREDATAATTLEGMKSNSNPVSFMSELTKMVRGLVEDVRYRQPPGSRYVYFDLYLVEDL